MKYLRIVSIILALLPHMLVECQVTTYSCDAISSDGACFKYFTGTGATWPSAETQCLAIGYDLATIRSLEENTLMYSTRTDSNLSCWIGLNDRNIEGSLVWPDGSDSTYRQYQNGWLNNRAQYDCLLTWVSPDWAIGPCDLWTPPCFFCSTFVNAFGQITASTYSALEDYAVLSSDTILYCITETMNITQVMWTYENLAGFTTNLAATTNTNSGVSTVQVYTTQPGYYRCFVTQNGGMSKNYTGLMIDTYQNTVPTTGCNAITNEGVCYRYFSSTGVNWESARMQCASRGYDLATVTSLEDNTVMYTTITDSNYCWIGLHDSDDDGTYVWSDGNSNTYRQWESGQPSNCPGDFGNCAQTYGQSNWSDESCAYTRTCYFCSTNVKAFGQIISSTYSAFTDYAVRISDTTLYCMTENMNTPQVMWSYEDLAGTRTDLTTITTTDVSTGVSTLQVYVNLPGYYTCQVTHNAGINTTYTAVMIDASANTGPTVITMNDGETNIFSLPAPNVNRAYITVLSQNVVLRTNQLGRWQTPNGSYVIQSSLTFSIFRISDEGLYKYYIFNPDGGQTLTIQIDISAIESNQMITNVITETSSESSILVTWDLMESSPIYSDLTYSVYWGFTDYTILAGTTSSLNFEITQLVANINYTIRVESQIPFSTQIISSTNYHFLGSTNTPTNGPITTPTNGPTTPMYFIYIIVVLIVMILILLIVVILIVVVVCCVSKACGASKRNSPHFEEHVYSQDKGEREIQEMVMKKISSKDISAFNNTAIEATC